MEGGLASLLIIPYLLNDRVYNFCFVGSIASDSSDRKYIFPVFWVSHYMTEVEHWDCSSPSECGQFFLHIILKPDGCDCGSGFHEKLVPIEKNCAKSWYFVPCYAVWRC